MFAAALLALSLAQGVSAQPSKLDQVSAATAQPSKLEQVSAEPAKPANVAVVVLNCQVDAKALIDCKAVNPDVDSHAAAEAIRMAAGITVPDSLAANGPSRIMIRMNVAP